LAYERTREDDRRRTIRDESTAARSSSRSRRRRARTVSVAITHARSKNPHVSDAPRRTHHRRFRHPPRHKPPFTRTARVDDIFTHPSRASRESAARHRARDHDVDRARTDARRIAHNRVPEVLVSSARATTTTRAAWRFAAECVLIFDATVTVVVVVARGVQDSIIVAVRREIARSARIALAHEWIAIGTNRPIVNQRRGP
jgi:hypothetical protein